MLDSTIIPKKHLEAIATVEDISMDVLKEGFENGTISILYNPNHKEVKPFAVGKGLTVKMNANIGTSPICSDQSLEIEKLKLCERYQVDAVMDLSLGENIRQLRKNIIDNTYIPVGTVPLYELFYYNQDLPENLIEKFLQILDESGQDGVDFVVIHAGLMYSHLELTKKRVIKVTSRGGSLLMRWMQKHQQENFLFTHFEQIMAICKKYNMTISLGDGMRPGSVVDETDAAQIEELKNIGDLVLRARKAGVQTIVEGPGHIPFHKIAYNMEIQKKLCHNAPFYVLGPLVTDIAPGYDHITAAIGATMAAFNGADFLCYVTPSEHLALPNLEDVKDGIIAFKIAAHAVDITRGKNINRDRLMSEARAKLDWVGQKKYALDPDSFDKYQKKNPEELKACTMCGDFCALK